MAESNSNRPASGALSAEDADRLSERFRPSWEPEPPARQEQAPLHPLKQTLVGGAVPGAARNTGASTPAAPIPAPNVFSKTAPLGAPGGAATSAAAPAQPTPGKPAGTVRRPTLVGIAPDALRARPLATPQGAAASPARAPAPPATSDDLDWELPAEDLGAPEPEPAAPAFRATVPHAAPEAVSRVKTTSPVAPAAMPTPPAAPAAVARTAVGSEPPMAVDIEELPPESKPSGIGQKYTPPDQNAPPVLLTEDVQRMEAEARARLEAHHRARSAQTMTRMPAVRAAPVANATDELAFRPPRRRTGLVVGILVVALGGMAGAALLAMRGKGAPPDEAVGMGAPPAPQARAPAADSLAPPPPGPAADTAAESPGAAPEAPSLAPEEPEVTPAGPASAEPAVAAGDEAKPEVASTRRTTSSPSRTSKPRPTASKPSSGSSAKAGKASSVIVRDNPF